MNQPHGFQPPLVMHGHFGTLKEQTREYILAFIRDQKLRPGDRLPGQLKLAKQLNVSQKITEVVFSELESEHVIIRRGGSGSFLAAASDCESAKLAGRNIFLLLSTLRNPHFANDAATLDCLLRSRGKCLRILTTEAFPTAREMIGMMVREGVAGIVSLVNQEAIRPFARRNNIPCVELHLQELRGRRPSGGRFIVAELASAARLLGTHLLELGHRSFYLAGDLFSNSQSISYRFEVLRKFLVTHGATVTHLPQQHPLSSYQSYEAIGAELAQTILQDGIRNSAAIFFNTQRAVGAMRYFLQHGISIPQRLSIAGFDAPLQGGFPEPAVTAVAHEKEMEHAVEMLFSTATVKQPQITTIPPTLLAGDTTAAHLN